MRPSTEISIADVLRCIDGTAGQCPISDFGRPALLGPHYRADHRLARAARQYAVGAEETTLLTLPVALPEHVAPSSTTIARRSISRHGARAMVTQPPEPSAGPA